MYTIATINTEEEDIRKERTIVLYKKPMSNEIDAHTSKFVDAGQGQSPRQDNAISSDTDETLDGSIIEQMMQYRDSQLRLLLYAFLQKEEVIEANNIIGLSPKFIYNLSFPENFIDAMLRPLSMLMNKYIVWGCLFDWYSQLGLAQAKSYGTQLQKIEDDILSMASPAGYEKIPLQPFGPAEKI